MPREKPTYRAALERLDEAFPDKEVLTQKELSEYLGLSVRFVRDKWKKNKMLGGYSKVNVAQILAQDSEKQGAIK